MMKKEHNMIMNICIRMITLKLKSLEKNSMSENFFGTKGILFEFKVIGEDWLCLQHIKDIDITIIITVQSVL